MKYLNNPVLSSFFIFLILAVVLVSCEKQKIEPRGSKLDGITKVNVNKLDTTKIYSYGNNLYIKHFNRNGVNETFLGSANYITRVKFIKNDKRKRSVQRSASNGSSHDCYMIDGCQYAFDGQASVACDYNSVGLREEWDEDENDTVLLLGTGSYKFILADSHSCGTLYVDPSKLDLRENLECWIENDPVGTVTHLPPEDCPMSN